MKDEDKDWMLGLRPVGRPKFRAVPRQPCQHCLDIRRRRGGRPLRMVVDSGTDFGPGGPEGSSGSKRAWKQPDEYELACRELFAAQSDVRRLVERLERLGRRLEGAGWES